MNAPDYEFLRDIAAAFAGVPAESVDMQSYDYSTRSPCETVGCVAAHLYRHPVLGIDASCPWVWHRAAAERISGSLRDWCEVYNLFDKGGRGEVGKREFASRVVRYLEARGQPVSEEYKKKEAWL